MAFLHYKKFSLKKLSNLHSALIHTVSRQLSDAGIKLSLWDIFTILVAMKLCLRDRSSRMLKSCLTVKRNKLSYARSSNVIQTPRLNIVKANVYLEWDSLL